MKRSISRVLGIIGYPLEHTLSPPMHNAAFAAVGLDWTYAVFRVPPGMAKEAVDAMRTLSLGGLSVTIPHKEAAVSAVDVLTREAEAIGAVNTIGWTPDESKLIGANTDVEGFVKGLEVSLGIGLEGRSLAIIGAGGAARAIAWAGVTGCAERIVIFARKPSRAADIAFRITKSAAKITSAAPEELPPIEVFSLEPTALQDVLEGADLLVNATPIGSDGVSIPVPDSAIHDKLFVYDLVYWPPRTRLVEAGMRRGAGGAGGLEMLIHQGARQFEMWTGLEAPIDAMREAVTEAAKSAL